MNVVPSRVAEKIGQYILLALSTDKDGEGMAAMRAVGRALDSENISIHEFTDAIKNSAAGNDGRTYTNRRAAMRCSKQL